MNKIEITNNAQEHIASVLKKDSASYFRITVLGGGCAGFKYDWGFIESKDKVDADDVTEDWGTGRFVVDDASMHAYNDSIEDVLEDIVPCVSAFGGISPLRRNYKNEVKFVTESMHSCITQQISATFKARIRIIWHDVPN